MVDVGNMKVVILAAGKGTRLAPLTDTLAKVLVPINGKPFLSYVLDNLIAAGYKEIAIVVGYRKEQIIDFVMRQYKAPTLVSFTFLEQQEQKGTGDALRCAKTFCGRDSFVVVGGDGLLSIEDFKRLNHNDGFCYIMGKVVDEPERYGILDVKNGFLEHVVEKPREFIGNLASAGVYTFTSEIWDTLDGLQPSQRGEFELTDSINILAKRKKVKVLTIHDYWLDLGKKEDVNKIELFLGSLSR
ncbi:NTP transferase domain-containing protein [Candidatus Woesearchaeota archaeon]|nr:NTP transferase domain-containing protein [Candidatus Woesearchaeota archaeon]